MAIVLDNGLLGPLAHVARPADQVVKMEGDNVSTQILPTKASRFQAQAHMQSPAITAIVLDNGRLGPLDHVARLVDQELNMEGDNVSTQIQPTKGSRVLAQARIPSPAIMVTVSVSFNLPLIKNVLIIKYV